MLTEDQLTEARNKLSAGRITAYRTMPYYTRALLAIEVFERQGLKTFGVDKYWRLYYDPQKCLEWTVNEIAAVWLHEVNHLIRKHNERWEALEGIGHDHETFNRAADASINTDLKSQGIILPNPELRVYIDSKLSPKWNSKMTAEQLYWEVIGFNRKKQELEEKKKKQEKSDEAAEGPESDDDTDSQTETPDADESDSEGDSSPSDGGGEDSENEDSDEDSESSSDSENPDSENPDAPEENDSNLGSDDSTEESGNGEEDDSADDSADDSNSNVSENTGDTESGEEQTSENEEPGEENDSSNSESSGGEGEDGSNQTGDESSESDGGESGDNDSESSQSGDSEGEEGGEPGESSDSAIPDGDCGSCAGGEQREYEEPTEKGALDPSTAEWIRHKTAEDIVDYASRNPGSVPGDVLREAKYIIEPQVDWREEFRSFFRRVLSNVSGYHDYTYARPSRRGGSTNVIMPSLRAPAPPELAAVLDTSGSMREGVEIAAALGELEGLLARFGQTNNGGRGMHIVSCDAGATDALIKDLREFQVVGGGGTDMRVGIEHAASLKPRMDVIVTVTDGGTPWPEKKPETNLMAHYVVLLVIAKDGWGSEKDIPEWMHVIKVQISDRKRPK